MIGYSTPPVCVSMSMDIWLESFSLSWILKSFEVSVCDSVVDRDTDDVGFIVLMPKLFLIGPTEWFSASDGLTKILIIGSSSSEPSSSRNTNWIVSQVN